MAAAERRYPKEADSLRRLENRWWGARRQAKLDRASFGVEKPRRGSVVVKAAGLSKPTRQVQDQLPARALPRTCVERPAERRETCYQSATLPRSASDYAPLGAELSAGLHEGLV